MTECPISTTPRELNPHVRFCAEQFGFKIEWRIHEFQGKVLDTKWYITHNKDRFFWTEEDGVENFFDEVRNYFYESGQESVSGW